MIEPYNEHYSATKRNSLVIYAATWMHLKMMFSERSQTKKKYILYDLIYIISQKRKLIQSDREQIVGAWEREERKKRLQKHVRKP